MLQTVVNLILNWLLSKAMDILTAYYKHQQSKKEIEKKNKDSLGPLVNADKNDSKAIDEAAKDALDGF